MPTAPAVQAPGETYTAVATLASPTAVTSGPVSSPSSGTLGPGLYDFTLPEGHGGQVTLSQYLGEKTVVLAFYRAWW